MFRATYVCIYLYKKYIVTCVTKRAQCSKLTKSPSGLASVTALAGVFSHFLPPCISKLLASCSTATNCYPVLMDRLPQPTDQTTHHRQITSLTAVTTRAQTDSLSLTYYLELRGSLMTGTIMNMA